MNSEHSPVDIWRACRVITMGFGQAAEPDGVTVGNTLQTAIAVRDGRVFSVGTLDSCRAAAGAQPVTIHDQFADRVIIPGMVEAHAHAAEGSVGTKVEWASWFDRRLADGRTSPGIKTYEALVTHLESLDQQLNERGLPESEPLVVGGFDPIYFTGERLSRHHLDRVDTQRPVVVQHASGHLTTVNSTALEHWSISPDLAVDGIGRDARGMPNGELREGAQSLLRGLKGVMHLSGDPDVVRAWAEAAARSGITTCADLASLVMLNDSVRQVWADVTGASDFPIRAVSYPVPQLMNRTPDELVDAFVAVRHTAQHDRWRLSGVKIILDGSIQGFTAALSWPGYHTGEGHAMFLLPIERMQELLRRFHRANINVHIHCNGDLASAAVLDAISIALQEHAWLDHRHTITHAQTMTSAQLHRAKALGVGINFFANHLWYWGDQHHDITLGPDRANRLDPCGEAASIGLRFAIHSDAPVTPIGQLHTMWCATQRRTPSGRILGEHQRITPLQALRAVTLDAAWMMHLDQEIGSLEVGKRADFTVLESDPLRGDGNTIKDISVIATALDGVPVG
jgi:predicted amidohydrolase YtcJ